MHPDVEALLALQNEDMAIRDLEERMAAFTPRLAALDRARQAALDEIARTQHAVQGEEKRQHELQAQVAKHKQLHERNVAQLDNVKRMRDASAAMAQLEAARRMLSDEEGELQNINRRLSELRTSIDHQQKKLSELDGQHAEERQSIADGMGEVEQTLKAARQVRDGSASHINRTLLSKYDRIRSARREGAIFALRGPSCGNCDTSVPLQRRHIMAARGNIEVCETCGVLLYAAAG